ncbi:MAG: ankyrin repeat domain-containing protein, partial [Thermodesulfobacteriota bacterium]
RATPLMLTAQNGQLHVVRVLLDNGAEPDAYHRTYGTALMLAAQNGHLQVARLLLEKGADPQIEHGRDTAVDLARSDIRSELARITGVRPRGLLDRIFY